MHTMREVRVRLEPVVSADYPQFRRDIQEAFSVAVVEEFGDQGGEPIPSDAELEAAFAAPGALVFHVVSGDVRVGGVVLEIHPETQRNCLVFFFISPAFHSCGFGSAAWREVERMFPDTVVWETVTPYFEKRNVHFYVNKCGFAAVEFFNRFHPDPAVPPMRGNGEPVPGSDEFFRFEKRMKE